MNRSRTILMAAFVLVLCAGIVVGRLWNQIPTPHPTAADAAPSWFAQELNLRPDQQTRIDAIWAEIKPQMDKSMERRQTLDRERDQAIQELLTPAEWTAYDKIIEDARAKRTELDKQRHQLVLDANERSKALLDDSQKQKWDAFGPGHPHDHDHHGPHGGTNATTEPAVHGASL